MISKRLKAHMRTHTPCLHVIDDTQVVLMSADTALHLMEEISQLHEDNQACHGQPDIPEKLISEMCTQR